MKALFEAFRKQCAELCFHADENTSADTLGEQIMAMPIPEGIVDAVVLHPMSSEAYPDKQGWYVDIDDKLYCDIEKDEKGLYSIYFRDRVTGNDGFVDQAPVSK